jgi:hypothetical protein
VHSVTRQHKLYFDDLSPSERQMDAIMDLTSIHAFHSGADSQAGQFGQKCLMQIAAVEHGHAEMPVFAVEVPEVGGLKQAAFLIQEVNPMNWLRFSGHGLKEAKRSEGSQRICAQAEPGTQRLKRWCLLVDFHVPT